MGEDVDYRPPTWAQDMHRSLTVAAAALCGAITIMTLTVSSGGAGPLLVMVLGLTGVGSAMWAVSSWFSNQEAKRRHDEWEKSASGEGLPQEVLAAGDLPDVVMQSNPARSLIAAVFTQFKVLYPRGDQFDFDQNGNLTEFGFYSASSGFLAGKGIKTRVNDFLRERLDGEWDIKVNAQNDTITGRQGSDLPNIATPPNWPVVRSRQEAAEWVETHPLHLGEGNGGQVEISLPEQPHVFNTGPTGGGKSAGMRQTIVERLCYGHRLFICDGKGTDYAAFKTWPNVSAVSTNLAEHIALIHKVKQIFEYRRARGTQLSSQGDTSWKQSLTPITFVVDEWAAVNIELANLHKDAQKTVKQEIDTILRVGREFRVFVLFASQDVRKETLPRPWLPQFRAMVSYGKPDIVTIQQGFPKEAQDDVSIIGSYIPPKAQGRALMTIENEDGEIVPMLFQSYYSYSPSESISRQKNPEVKAAWQEFKEQVTDQIPRLYPREWFHLEYPQPEGGKSDPYKDLREEEGVDLSQMKVDDLHRLEPVLLEQFDDSGELHPIAEHAIYDPTRPEYLGHKVSSKGLGNVIDF